MSIIEAVILGIIQGFSEFLPISSSGHLAVGKHFFGIDEGGMTFVIVVHLGTLLPVLLIFRKDIWSILRRPFQKLTALLIVGTLPAVVVALFFSDFVETMFTTINVVAVCFIVTGIVLMLSDKISKNTRTMEGMGFKDALLIGCAQGVAVMPGISRSGSTITASLARGLNRESAARFAFLMSIPAILGAAVLEVAHIATGRVMVEELDLIVLGAGFIASALSGYLAINWLLAIVRRAKLKYFSFYLFALATFILLWTNFA